MRITGNPEGAGTGRTASSNAPAKSRSRFSEVLKEDKHRGADARAKDGEESLAANAGAPVLSPPLPFGDVAPVDAGQAVAVPTTTLLASLVQEITVEAPPGGNASVDIQFDSRTLDGLQVRVQKKGDNVEVRFTTSSDAVSQLLTANAQSLADALVERGYVAPAVSVQRAPGPTKVATGDFRRSGRDDGNRGGREQGGGSQKRR
jgi:hypothetical protein